VFAECFCLFLSLYVCVCVCDGVFTIIPQIKFLSTFGGIWEQYWVHWKKGMDPNII
jgi:hypothetical protein